MDEPSAVLSRSRSSDAPSPELRQDIPLLFAQVLDAVANARRTTRTALVNSILDEWVRQQVHEATLIARVTRGNPDLSDINPPAGE